MHACMQRKCVLLCCCGHRRPSCSLLQRANDAPVMPLKIARSRGLVAVRTPSSSLFARDAHQTARRQRVPRRAVALQRRQLNQHDDLREKMRQTGRESPKPGGTTGWQRRSKTRACTRDTGFRAIPTPSHARISSITLRHFAQTVVSRAAGTMKAVAVVLALALAAPVSRPLIADAIQSDRGVCGLSRASPCVRASGASAAAAFPNCFLEAARSASAAPMGSRSSK